MEAEKVFGFGPGVEVKFVGFGKDGEKVYATNVFKLIAKEVEGDKFKTEEKKCAA